MKTWLRTVLATVAVVGGFTGTFMTLPLVLHPSVDSTRLLITAVFLLMFLFVGASGVIFIANPRRTIPLFVALVLQTPYLSSPLFTYKFGAALPAFIFLGPPSGDGNAGFYIGWDATLGSSWRFGYAEDGPWRIGINVVAAFLAYLLAQSMHESPKQQHDSTTM